jgi:hypothetical protein
VCVVLFCTWTMLVALTLTAAAECPSDERVEICNQWLAVYCLWCSCGIYWMSNVCCCCSCCCWSASPARFLLVTKKRRFYWWVTEKPQSEEWRMKSYNWWNLKGSRSIIAKETRHDFDFELQEVKLQNSLQLKLLWRIEELQKNEIFKVFKVIDNLHPIIRRSWEKRKILINFLYNFFSFSATFCANRIEKSSEQRHTQKNTAWRDTFLCFSDSLTKQEAWIGFLWFHFFFLMRSNTPKATISEILQNYKTA